MTSSSLAFTLKRCLPPEAAQLKSAKRELYNLPGKNFLYLVRRHWQESNRPSLLLFLPYMAVVLVLIKRKLAYSF
jgi:hypothetical protein